MREIAAQAGVSTMTVSRVLRNDPKISTATKAKVNRLCQQLGYKPDPRLSELMSHLRRSQAKRTRETIALIHILPEVETGAPLLTERRQISGLMLRAEELGLAVDTFEWKPSKLSTKALRRILHTRGIRGAAVLTRGAPPDDIHLLRENFAIATLDGIGERLHHAYTDHFQAMSLLVEKLFEKGYRRPAFFLLKRVAPWTFERWQAAFMYRASQYGPFDPRLMHVASSIQDDALLRWIGECQPDVLISHIPIVELRQSLEKGGFRIPRDIGIASVEWMPQYPDISGIDQNPEHVGMAVTDLIARQIAYNEIGLPRYPKKVLVEAEWRDAPSLRENEERRAKK